jgi:methionyl-tRNA synthetase
LFLPKTAKKLVLIFGVSEVSNLSDIILVNKISNLGLLFTKVEDDIISNQLTKLSSAKIDNSKVIVSSVSVDDFAKVSIVVSTVVSAEVLPKSDKLLKLVIDDGTKHRTVLSGIAKSYAPEALIGKQVLLLANLAPRTMRGVVSEGMILLTEDEKGNHILVSPEKPVPNGSKLS